MKYVLCLALLAITACAPGTPYPTSYTGAPSPDVLAPGSKGKTRPTCPLGGKPCCDMPCCKGDKKGHQQHGNGHDHSAHSHGEVDIYAPVMADMHKAMGAYTPTGDADVDFVQGMIPHHQGAVDMANLVLEHGDDPHVRRLARDIILSQRREIAFMKYWLRTRGQLPDSNISNVNVTE